MRCNANERMTGDQEGVDGLLRRMSEKREGRRSENEEKEGREKTLMGKVKFRRDVQGEVGWTVSE